MAIKTLAELQEEIEAHEAASSPGTPSEKVFGILVQLLQTLQASKEVPVAKNQVDALNATINNQAKILQATKDALHIADSRTMVQMPEDAAAIYADSLKWKGTV